MTVANIQIDKIRLKRGNTAVSTAYTGVVGEITMDTTLKTVRVHDGVTIGGTRLATHAELSAVSGNVDLSGYATNANVTAANAAITALQSNAAIQAQQIANVSGTYGNANVKSYLGAFDGNIVPDGDNTRDLGSPTNQWRHVYTGGGSIYLDNIKLTNNAGKLEVTKVINPGEDNEEPDPEDSNAGDSVTSKLTNGEHEFVLTEQGTLELDGDPFTGGGGPGLGNFTIDGDILEAEEMTIRTNDGDLIVQSDSDVVIRASGTDKQWQFNTSGNLELPEGGDIVDHMGMSVLGGGGGGGISIVRANVAPVDTTALWYDTNSGRLYVYYDSFWIDTSAGSGGAVTGNIVVGDSQIQFVANSSGDGYGLSTIRLVPYTPGYDTAHIIIDPTYPNHIHIRAGGEQDNSAANLFLGGEASHFNVEEGANPNVSIRSNHNTWTFDTDGDLALPNGSKLKLFNPGSVELTANTGENSYASLASFNANNYIWVDNTAAYIGTNWQAGPKTWTFGSDGTTSFPDNELKTSIANDLSIVTQYLPTEPPTTIVISGADFVAVNLTYTKDGANSVWYPAGYNPANDPYIEFTGGQYGIFVPGFGQALYVNTGTLNVPSAHWNINPPLGSVPPTGVYTYPNTYTHAWTFGANGNLTVPGNIVYANGDSILANYATISSTLNSMSTSQSTNDFVSGNYYNADTLSVEYTAYTGASTLNFNIGYQKPLDGNIGINVAAISTPLIQSLDGTLTMPVNITGANVISASTFVSNSFHVVTAGNLSITSQYGLGTTGTILEDNGTLELIANGGGSVVAGWDSTYGNGLGNLAVIGMNALGSGGVGITTGNQNTTIYNWVFNQLGQMNFPGGGSLNVKSPAPTHSYGVAGDQAGMIAFDNDYFYYCKTDYVNNSTDIWVRVVWTSSSW